MREDWTEKYRPRSLSQVVGNESAIRAIRRWAESWAHGVPKVKALILKGEPGIGKTSSALALAYDLKWDVVEMNASDHRNAESIKKVAGIGSMTQTFTLDGEFLSSHSGRRKLIILDEADNLFGREDYGGAKAIVDTIRESSQPILLIVNDYYELTRRASALKRLATSVTFRRLDQSAIVVVLRSIAGNENVTVSLDTLGKIASNAGGDLRAAINDLQMIVEGRSHLDAEDTDVIGERNQEKELSRALSAMFGAKTVREAQDATLNLDKMPDELEKWIEESIPSEMKDPEDLARAFDALSRSNIYLRRARALQHYGMWSYARTMMTAGVALSRKSGRRPHVSEYRFPSFLIVMSRAKGTRASRKSISSKLAPYFHTSSRMFGESILPYLSKLLTKDRELMVKLACETELDDGDISNLLHVDSDSSIVKAIRAEIIAIKGEDEVMRKKTPRRKSGRSLTEF